MTKNEIQTLSKKADQRVERLRLVDAVREAEANLIGAQDTLANANRSLGMHLRASRKLQRVTAAKVAHALLISPAHLSCLENGRANARWTERLVADYLDAIRPAGQIE